MAVPLAFAVLALALPTGNADADVGNLSWASSSINSHLTGSNWDDVSDSIKAGILYADNEWRNETLWDPTIILGSSDNDWTWGEVAPSSPAWSGCNPTGGTKAVECTKVSGSTTIVESDIRFNDDPDNWTWNAGRAQGIATHELGHGGGLTHSTAQCGSTDPDRLTLCADHNEANANDASSLEGKDISDADTNYGP